MKTRCIIPQNSTAKPLFKPIFYTLYAITQSKNKRKLNGCCMGVRNNLFLTANGCCMGIPHGCCIFLLFFNTSTLRNQRR